MTIRKGIPEHSATIIPRLFCSDPDTAADFYVAALGARDLGRRAGPDGRTVHALLELSGGMIMVEAEWPGVPCRAPAPDGSSPVAIFAYVDDVDATVERTLLRGAQLLIEAANQFWGDRTAWIVDPAGHVWTLASRVEDTTEEERQIRWAEIAAQQGNFQANMRLS
jgi:PhnB protein